jgi:internalin A
MKSISTVALIINMWAFSGWGWGIAQATEPNSGSSFKEWCQKQASLSAEARITVEVLLAKAGTNDCELAAKNLLSLTELYLS